MKTLFKIGDKVVHKDDKEYTGTVTKVKYIQAKGLTKYGDYQWLWLDNSDVPCGCTSECFEIDKSK